jgi:hypothetical protein
LQTTSPPIDVILLTADRTPTEGEQQSASWLWHRTSASPRPLQMRSMRKLSDILKSMDCWEGSASSADGQSP